MASLLRGGNIQRDFRRPAQALLGAHDQAAPLQLLKGPRRHLAATAQLFLGFLHGEVEAHGSVRLQIAVVLGEIGPVEQQGVEQPGVIGDTQRYQKPGKWEIGGRGGVVLQGVKSVVVHASILSIHQD